MNNKGFTLIELLAVIVILSTLSIVAVLSVTSSLERREEKECQEQIALAKNAAKIYFSLTKTTSVKVKVLRDGDFFNEASKINMLNLDDTITVDMANNTYIYAGTGDCKES